MGVGLPDTEFVNYRALLRWSSAWGCRCWARCGSPTSIVLPNTSPPTRIPPSINRPASPLLSVSPDNKALTPTPAIFRGYREDAFYIYKEIAARLLAKLLPELLVKTSDTCRLARQSPCCTQRLRTVSWRTSSTSPRARLGTATNEFIEDATPVNDVRSRSSAPPHQP